MKEVISDYLTHLKTILPWFNVNKCPKCKSKNVRVLGPSEKSLLQKPVKFSTRDLDIEKHEYYCEKCQLKYYI